MALDFPASPSTGDQVTLNGVVYEYDGNKWVTLRSLFNRGEFTAGTEAEPGFSVNGDNNTGLYAPAADSLGLVTGGNEALRIDSSGRVGIGTSSPTNTSGLEIQTTSSSAPGLWVQTGGTTSAYPILDVRNGANLPVFAVKGDGASYFQGGNVGIGTTSPSGIFHISSSSPRIVLTDTGTGADHRINGDSSVGNLAFDVDLNSDTSSPSFVLNIKGSEKFRVLSSGNVGIGTTSPAQKLHIVASSGVNNCVRAELSGSATYETNAGHFVNTDSGTGSARGIYVSGTDFGVYSNSGTNYFGGNVGIGITSPSYGLELSGTGNKSGFRISDTFNSRSIDLRADATGGLLKTAGAYPFVFSTNNTERMRILSGGGLTFNGDTATANALDDYEEGTFTPTFINVSNFNYSTQTGRYVKIGKIVTVYIMLATHSAGSITGTGTVQIDGLPFSAENNANAGTSMLVLTHDNRFTNNPRYGQIRSGSKTRIELFKTNAMNTANGLTASDFLATNSSNYNLLSVNFTYEVD